jgi:hypothetical protein
MQKTLMLLPMQQMWQHLLRLSLLLLPEHLQSLYVLHHLLVLV